MIDWLSCQISYTLITQKSFYLFFTKSHVIFYYMSTVRALYYVYVTCHYQLNAISEKVQENYT